MGPISFLVTTKLAFAMVFSFGPLYGPRTGCRSGSRLQARESGFTAVAAVAHRQLVRSAPPVDAGRLPSGPQFERLLYAGVGLGIAYLVLTLTRL